MKIFNPKWTDDTDQTDSPSLIHLLSKIWPDGDTADAKTFHTDLKSLC